MSYIEEILAIHFDEKFGSRFWLDVKKTLSFDPCQEIKSRDGFHLLGPMNVEALRRRPLLDFIPKCLHNELPGMILSETGGTTGTPCRRVFLADEFTQAFLDPWSRAAQKRGFPMQAAWLFIGPSGPHIIGQAARAMSRKVGSLECFSVDCDVRWFKKQAPDSLGATLYLDHVMDQALNIIDTQNIEVLFTTPPLLRILRKRISEEQRRIIRGIHLGGTRLDSEEYQRINEQDFPQAVLLPGYGNSLSGVAFEDSEAAPGSPPVYHIDDPALWMQIIPDSIGNTASALERTQPPGVQGRIVLHRLDKSFMIVNLLERDMARYVDSNQDRITGVTSRKESIPHATGLY